VGRDVKGSDLDLMKTKYTSARVVSTSAGIRSTHLVDLHKKR